MKVAIEQRTNMEQSWVPSVAFWLCLFVAAALFAIPFLAPKLLTHARLSSRFDDNQARLVTLSEHCEQLKIVQDALQSDPGFQAELARIEFDAVNPAEQRLPVGNGLTLNAIAAAPLPAPPGNTLAWYAPLLEFLTENRSYTHCMLAFAAVLVVYGFVGLHRPHPSL
jgi:hypothetical protein